MSETSIQAPSGESTLERVRREKTRRLLLRILVGIGLPTLVSFVYFAFVATPQFESQAVVAVDAAGGASVMSTVPGTNIPRDVMVVQEYALSRDAFRRLVEQERYDQHFRSPRVDRFSRMTAKASFEDAYAYYRSHVDVAYDPQTSFLTLKVRAFSGADAHRFAVAILRASEEKINRQSREARDARIAFARAEADASANRLAEAQAKVTELDARIRARQASGVTDDPAAAADSAALELATVRKDLALRTYQSALDSLESTQAEAQREHRYLVTISEPSQPDVPSHPVVWRMVLAVFIASATLLVIGSILFAVALEHANL
ncbi:MAG: hypothetical protein U0230_28240 [Polyangiales bacterium]